MKIVTQLGQSRLLSDTEWIAFMNEMKRDRYIEIDLFGEEINVIDITNFSEEDIDNELETLTTE
jgi:hypothetical protein